MVTENLSPELMAEALAALEKSNGNKSKAARLLRLPRNTYNNRLQRALDAGSQASLDKLVPKVNIELELKDKIRTLEARLKATERETLDERFVKIKILQLAESEPKIPTWLSSPSKKASKSPGVPTLFASDWHSGEVVDPDQIGGVNEFNLTIMHERARRLITVAIDLLNNHMVNPDYPGIVFALGGDMVSGDIHEELMATNEKEIMAVIIDLFGVLIWCISTLADSFGKVFVPCVSGNHGRNTHKIRAKGRNYTNFDWLLYQMLAKHFEADERITFNIPSGSDCLYSVYSHRYLLSHGDQFRGGDSLIGCLGPVIRGDHKKRGRNAQINMEYDTMIIGHWHQLIQLERLIINGSLKGYDEYAYTNNFPFEPPRQALWITHPDHGITIRMPVNVSDLKHDSTRPWVSWLK